MGERGGWVLRGEVGKSVDGFEMMVRDGEQGTVYCTWAETWIVQYRFSGGVSHRLQHMADLPIACSQYHHVPR